MLLASLGMEFRADRALAFQGRAARESGRADETRERAPDVARATARTPRGDRALASRIVPVPQPEEFEATKVLARVGSEVILAGDVLGGVNEMLRMNASQIAPEQYEAARLDLMQRAVSATVETKILLAEAKRKIPEEALPKIMERMEKIFETEELPKMMKRTHVKSLGEFERNLRALGSSLAQQKRNFCESALAHQWARQQIKYDEEITHQQMMDFYQHRLYLYEIPARVRWEHLMTRNSSYASKQEARRALARMGNEVWHGAPWDEVARRGSDGTTAEEGGLFDWTARGSFSSQAVDQALFELPIGEMSPIIEDERGFHIVRVLEREDGGHVPFLEAQVEIKKRIKEDRVQAQILEYMAKVRKRTPVWTIFDTDPRVQAVARPDAPDESRR